MDSDDGPACKSARRYNINYYILKRAQWQNSNNDFPFFGPRQDPKNEKSFVGALLVTVCRASSTSFFGRNARWNLNLGSRFANRRKKGKEKVAKTKCAWTTNDRSRSLPVQEQNLERNVRFENNRDRDRENSKNRWTKPKYEWHAPASFQLRPPSFELYFLKQIATRKRAYPTRDCDNLPGPTYL